MRIAVGADHGGFDLKEEIKSHLESNGYEVVDLGCFDKNPVEYPDVALTVANKVVSKEFDLGILFCGTGIGISIAANKVRGIRAALLTDCFSARMAREHNDANIITLGGRTCGVMLAKEIVDSFLKAEFQGGIHSPRVKTLTEL